VRQAPRSRLTINYIGSKEGADRVVADIKESSGKAIAVNGDVTKAADVQRLFDETKKPSTRSTCW
jgi:3-oxoacyl-[acyl-carrier protein] reductase